MRRWPAIEAAIAQAVLRHFAQQPGHHVCYNTDPHYGQIDQFAQHNIHISGRYPDILVLTPGERVLAIEAKRPGGDVVKSLGQALMYKDGTPFSYVALDSQDAEGVESQALGAGIGVIKVQPTSGVVVLDPPHASMPLYQQDVLRGLRILLFRNQSGLRLTALQLNHPLHYLAPLFYPTFPTTTVEFATWVEETWGLGAVSHLVRGATALQILKRQDQILYLSASGQRLRAMIRHCGKAWTPGEVRVLTSRQEALPELQPFLAALVYMAFMETEDVRTIVEALTQREDESAWSLVRVLAQSYPNALLNVFAAKEYHSKLIRLINRRALDELLAPGFVAEWMPSWTHFQLKRQLQHAGILQSGRGLGLCDTKVGYNPHNDIWRLATPRGEAGRDQLLHVIS